MSIFYATMPLNIIEDKTAQQRYYDKRRAICNARSRKFYHDHLEHCRALSRKYAKRSQSTIGYRFRMYKSSAVQRKYVWAITRDEFESFWKKPCHYCGDSVATIGLDRLNNKIGYIMSNLVSCCRPCNIAKQSMSPGGFVAHCRKVAEHSI